MRIFLCIPARTTGPKRAPSFGTGDRRGGPILLVGLILLLIAGVGASDLHGQWPGEIRGQLVDARSGRGVANARVTVDGTPLAVLSNGDGRFLLKPVDEGEALVRVQRYGYQETELRIEVRPGVTRVLSIPLSPVLLELGTLEVGARRRAGETWTISRVDIDGSGAHTLGELVEGVPGLSLVRRGAGGAETVSIRGAPTSHTLVLVDGALHNDPVTGIADLSTISSSRIASVEVLPGSQGARYGPGAIGGVILVTTSNAESDAEASLGVGSLGERRGTLAARMPGTRLEISGRAWHATMRGEFPFERDPRVGGGHSVRRNGDSTETGVRLAVTPGPEGIGGDWALSLEGGILDRGIPGKSYAPSPGARQELKHWNLRGRWDRPLGGAGSSEPAGPNHPELRIRTGVEHRELGFRDPAPPLGPPFDHQSGLLSWDVGAELDGLSVAGGRVRGGVGAQLRSLRLRSDALRTDAPSGHTPQGGVFAHAETQLSRVPRQPVLRGALRLDRGPTGPIVSHELALRAALTGVHFHLAHRTAFAPPSPGDQYFRDGVGISPNPDLRPERVPGEIEAGLSTSVAAGPLDLRVGGTAFRGDIDDHIVWAPDFRFVWSPRNVDVRRRGFTVEGDFRHRRGVSVSGHLSRADVTYRRSAGGQSSQLAYRPRTSGQFSFAWDGGPWEARVVSRYTGPRYPFPAPVNELAGFWSTAVTLSGGFELDDWRVGAVLRIDRIFDEVDPFIFSVPEPGRTARLELRIRRAH